MTFLILIDLVIVAMTVLGLRTAWHTRELGSVLFLGFVVVFLLDPLSTVYRWTVLDVRLVREGNVTVGWISDYWVLGRHQKQNRITVEYDDTGGHHFEKDFTLDETPDISGPGDPILVFYQASEPKRCTVLGATLLRPCVPGDAASVGQGG